ncbi:hypothetical protein A6V39_00455 [Candidatus Mycoplasma haematobovis]|uniref:Uncharacterized protein n=1 Tax=Candidatus Mycoplasma haematobovis TaxID=432608 RepID=A0A1A9QET6_9MOLU|nr:hypothetical protein [Candidatus Mycoplasma haematobovis]OAL10521.1 hypothetical protein A6V39_00455 [Candidatus Mycoplasma haematobovis]
MAIKHILITDVGVSTIAEGVGVGFYLTNNYTIEQLLNKENPKKVSLKKELANKAEWLEKWKEYIKANKTGENFKDEDAWKLKEWNTIKTQENQVPDAFAEKCEEKLNDKVAGSKDPKYIEFVGWCVK